MGSVPVKGGVPRKMILFDYFWKTLNSGKWLGSLILQSTYSNNSFCCDFNDSCQTVKLSKIGRSVSQILRGSKQE
jgi:hypothetical protein